MYTKPHLFEVFRLFQLAVNSLLCAGQQLNLFNLSWLLDFWSALQTFSLQFCQIIDSSYADLGNPSVVLQFCIYLHFLSPLLSSDLSANIFAIFFLNFNIHWYQLRERTKVHSVLFPKCLSPSSFCLFVVAFQGFQIAVLNNQSKVYNCYLSEHW